MRHEIFNIPIDDLSDTDLNTKLAEWVNQQDQKFITTPNPEFVLLAKNDDEFRKILQSSDLSLPDGVGLKFAIAALTDEKLSHRQTGVELVGRLMSIAHANNKKILLFGGEDGAAQKTKEYFEKMYSNISISMFNPGSVSFPVSDRIVDELNSIAPDIFLVALGQKKQEKFIQEILPNVPSIKIAVGIGGAFEMLSGQKPRAPIFMRKMGLEWLWRVFIEPTRIGRILNASFVFPIIVICDTLRQHRFWKACKNVIPEIFRQLRNV